MSNEKDEVISITPDKDVLIRHRNNFQKTLLDNILDLKRHEAIKEIKPDYQRKDQNGRYVDIDELIEGYRKGAANAKSYVDIIDGLLALEAEGKLNTSWADISESGVEAKKEEVKEEVSTEAKNEVKPEVIEDEEEAEEEIEEDTEEEHKDEE